MDENVAVGKSRSARREQRFEALYAEHHPQVFGYVMRRCDRAADGADAIAETFLVAWRRLDDAPGEDQLRSWLYGIARRVLANQRRAERRRTALAQQLVLDLSRQPLPLTTTYETAIGERSALRDALLSLSGEDRELLMLEAWEGLTSNEIAAVFDCSPGAARTRLHRARQRLHAALAPNGATVTGPIGATAPETTSPEPREITATLPVAVAQTNFSGGTR